MKPTLYVYFSKKGNFWKAYHIKIVKKEETLIGQNSFKIKHLLHQTISLNGTPLENTSVKISTQNLILIDQAKSAKMVNFKALG